VSPRLVSRAAPKGRTVVLTKRSAAKPKAAAKARKPAQTAPAKARRPAKRRAVIPKWMERMQTVLHEERERLADRLEDVGNFLNDKGWGGRAEIATTDDDTVDMASQAVERERELALRSNLEDLLERVEKALAKIDEGEYGVCERCGEKISRERLKAVPHATMCVRCRAIIDG
jgi:DnaK suppressor protein